MAVGVRGDVGGDDGAVTGDRGPAMAVALASASILAAAVWPMARGRIYVADDLQKFHLPLRAFYADCLARGDRFEWCPGLYCGFDLHGEGQVGMVHPLHLALYGLLPLTVAFNLELLANYAFAFAGMALFLRGRGLPRGAALFGGLAYSVSGFFTVRYMFLNFLAIAAHIPWILLAIDVVLRGGTSTRRAWAALAMAFLLASQLLLGYPQSFWESLLAAGIYALWVATRDGPGWPRRLALLLGAGALGVLLGGVQLVPTAEALEHSVRADPTPGFLAHGSVHPANLLQLVSPYLFRDGFFTTQPPASIGAHELALYAGAASPVLLAWLWIRRRDLAALGPLTVAAVLIGAVALALSFGNHNPLFPYYTQLPVLSMFRISARYIALIHLATAILAAIALADLDGRARRGDPERARISRRHLRPLLIPLGISLAVGVGSSGIARAWPGSALAPFLATTDRALGGSALVAAATALVWAAARGWRPALVGLVLFAAADQSYYGLTFLRRDPPTDLASLLATRELPPVAEGERIMVPEGDDLWLLKGAKLVEGYAALKPSRRLHYYDRSSLRLAGARWILQGDAGGRLSWMPLADPLPRVRLVARTSRRMLVGGPVDPDALVNTAFVPTPLDLPAGGTPGAATLAVDRPGRIEVEVEVPSRQVLILSESHHEGWRVRVDGRDREVLRVDGDFLGCVVERGTHRVMFRYRSPGFLIGATLSLLGLVIAAAVAAALLAIEIRRGRAEPGG